MVLSILLSSKWWLYYATYAFVVAEVVYWGGDSYTLWTKIQNSIWKFFLVRQWGFSGNLPGTYTEGLWHVFDKVNFEQNWNINTFCHNPVVVGLQPVPLQHVSHFSIIDTVFIILWTWFRKVRNRYDSFLKKPLFLKYYIKAHIFREDHNNLTKSPNFSKKLEILSKLLSSRNIWALM